MGMRRIDQQWIYNSMLAQQGMEAFFKDAIPGWVHDYGYDYADTKRTMERIRCIAQIPDEWERTAQQTEHCAHEEEQAGHHLTARLFYHRAALYYVRAQWAIFEDNNHKAVLLEKARECYDKVIEFCDYPIERVEIPFGSRSLPGLLHRPPGKGPFPCVIFVPGMDMTKEEYPWPERNAFLSRGMAVLSMDGPGQGESNIRRIRVTADNHAEAGRATVDLLFERPDIDHERIAVFGVSMGSYWAPLMAAHDSRINACVAAIACFGNKQAIFNEANLLFRWNFMYMAGIDDDAEFDRFAEGMVLTGRAAAIRCPTLFATGQYDPLSHLEDTESIWQELSGPKELWIFERQFHSIGAYRGELYPRIADWLNDALNHKLANDLSRRVSWPTR